MARPKKTTLKENAEDLNPKDKRAKVIKELNKKFGKQIIRYASEEPDKQRIPFGIESIDAFTGGGSVRGNIVIIYGGESTGKTTLVMSQIAQAQIDNLTCVYIDLEHGFNKERATKLGVDLTKLILMEDIATAEEAMDIIITLCKEKIVDLIVVDSVQAMSPKGEQETKTGGLKSIEDDEMALLARKLGKFFRVAGSHIYNSNASVVLIGQIRTEGIGSFATRDGLSGGHALKHFSLLTLYMRRGQKADAPTHKVEDEETGQNKKVICGFDSVIKAEKVKVNGCKPEGSDIHIPFYFESGYKQNV